MAAVPGTTDDPSVLSYIFGGNTNLTYEQLQRRRAVATALASRARGFPKNIGEGLTYLGEAIGDTVQERQLQAAEKAYQDKLLAAGQAAGMPGGPPGAAVAPAAPGIPLAPGVPAAAAVPAVPALRSPGRPSPLPPGPSGPMAYADPRNNIAAALRDQEVAQSRPTLTEGPDTSPPGGRLASVNATDTMSDAPPILPGNLPGVNDDQPTPTTISPAPIQLAQAGPGGVSGAPAATAPAPQTRPGGLPGGIPGPLDAPVPGPANPSFGRTPVQPTTPQRMPPTPPILPEITDYEKRGYLLQRQFPGDPNAAAMAQKLIDFGAAQRKAQYDRDVEVYKGELARYEKEELARQEFERNRPKFEGELLKNEQDLAKAREEAELRNRMGGVSPALLEKAIEKSIENVKGIPAAQASINNARQMLATDRTMFTGGTAEMRLSMQKLAAAMGFPLDPKVSPTEQFKSFVSPIIAQMRASLAGNANISDADMRAAVAASGGDIKLERASILAILNGIEKINVMNATTHQGLVNTYAGNSPNRQQIMAPFRLPMETIVPREAVELLRANAGNPAALDDFDRAFHTPGLAQRVLMMPPRR